MTSIDPEITGISDTAAALAKQLTSSGRAPEDVFRRVAGRLGKFFHASAVTFARKADELKEFELVYQWNDVNGDEPLPPIALGSVVNEKQLEMLTRGVPVEVSGTGSNASRDLAVPSASVDPARSFVIVPYLAGGRLTYVLSVFRQGHSRWHPEEVRILTDASERIFPRYERSLAQAALARLTMFDEAILGNIAEGLCTLDKAGRVLTINPAGEQILGWPSAELIGSNLHDRVHPASANNRVGHAANCDLLKALSRHERSLEVNDVFMRRDGHSAGIIFSVSPLRENGETAGSVIVFRDVTEKRVVETRLRESEERFARFMQNLPGLAWIKDGEGRYVYANAAAETAFRTSREDLYGKSDFEIFDEKLAETFVRNDAKALEHGNLQTVEVLDDEAGNPRYSIVNKFAIPIDGADPLVGGIAIDITEQKRAQEDREFLFSISETIRVSRDPGKLLSDISTALGKYLGVHRCLFNEIDLDTDTETVYSDFSRDGASVAGVHRISDYSSVMSESMMSGKTVVNRDSKTDERTAELYQKVYRPNKERAYVAVPMLREGKWVASLWCSDDKPQNWTDREISLLENIAERTWAAVERLRAEVRLRESEEKYRTLFESIDEGFAVVEMIFDDNDKPVDYRFIQVNPSFANLTGLPADAPGKTARELVPDLEEFWFETYGEVALTGRSVRFEHRSDAMGRWFDVYASRVGGDNNRQVAIVFSNITERKAAEVALRESEEKFRTLSDTAPALIWFDDPEGKAVFLNKAYADFYGKAPDQLDGDRWQLELHPDEANEYISDFLEAQRERREFYHRVRARRHDGQWRWLESYARPLFAADGTFLGHVGISPDITDSVEAESALRESRERLRLAQYAGNIGVWDWDVQTDKTYWSETMWMIYGEPNNSTDPDDTFWTKHLHEDDRDRVKQHLDETAHSDRTSFRDEFRIRTGNGEIKWIDTIATIVRDTDGRPSRMYGVNIDITDRKLSEERTLRSENQLRLVTNSMPALIAYMDQNLRYRFVNERYTDWFGVKTDDILGKRVRDVIGTRAYNVVHPSLTAALGGEEISVQTTLNYKGAGKRFVQVNYIPDVSEDGSVRGIFSLVNDLTAWKESQDLLRSSKQRLAMMIESVSDYAIVSMDPKGTIETWNEGAANIFGYSAAEVVGRSVSQFFPEGEPGEKIAEAEMKAARRRGKASDERWLVKKDGTRFYASGVLMPIRVDRKLNGFVKIISDLTERKRRAELLQSAHDELERRVDDRTRDLAELNEALRKEIAERERSEAMKIGLLRRIVSAQETERQRIARDIHDQLGQRLTALRLKLAALRSICGNERGDVARVERLQEIARLLDSEVSFLASELRPNTLDDLGLEAALSAHAADWSRHYEVKLEFHSMGKISRSLGRDTEIQLYRIAQEALNNVAKHAQATQVGLLLEQTADSLALIVEDNGIGFDEEASMGPSGRGMGLVGMKERASLIGATLEIESEKGTGTTIFVRLPLNSRVEEE